MPDLSALAALPDPRRVLILCTSDAQAGSLRSRLDARLGGAEVETWCAVDAAAGETIGGAGPWGAGTLCAQPGLVASLRERLQAQNPDWIVLAVPTDAAQLRDESALLWAALSAVGQGLTGQVVLDFGADKAHWTRPMASALFALRRLLPEVPGPTATAVVSTWNKCEDVCANLEALRAQVEPFAEIVLVDNASRDETVAEVRRRFPRVRIVIMPHDKYGACETFNIGFSCALSELTAILDDDVVLPANWLALARQRLLAEPATTAIVSTKIVEPGMPESYKNSPEINSERYMSTFRGCASLARSAAIAKAGYYDVRLFIYGNERDLTCRLLNLGYRVLQFPKAIAYHKTPFGIKMGKRSLYFHARNAWLSMLKYAPAKDLARMPFQVFSKVLLRSKAAEESGAVSDATGTIGIGRSIRETKGAWWVLCRAGFSVLWNVPYCLKHRAPVRAEDFELPLD
ncbi:MAG: glycosyltransferase family 2 protein [Planctomycetota bacterium]